MRDAVSIFRYGIVLDVLECPKTLDIVDRGVPLANMLEAREWRKLCAPKCLPIVLIPALLNAVLTISLIDMLFNGRKGMFMVQKIS